MVSRDDPKAQKLRSRLDLAGRLVGPRTRPLRRSRLKVDAAATPARISGRSGDGESVGAEHPRDVLCGGMYRACSTWQYEVISHLCERYLDGERLGYITSSQYIDLVRSDAQHERKSLETRARWRILKSHDRHPVFARALGRGEAVALYAFRDVREVVFSLMHKRGMTFEQLLRHGMIHQVLANDRFWTAQPDVLIQRYEDLLAEPARGVAELANHLGIVLAEGEADRIASEYSHEANRARTEALRRQLQEAGVNLDNAANLQICDSKTLLHWNHIRQGDARSWRSLAIPRERWILDRLCGRWLKAHSYPPDAGLGEDFKLTFKGRLEIEKDLLAAYLTFLIRQTSERFPRLARLMKQALGMADHTQAGATAWADAPPEDDARRSSGGSHHHEKASRDRPRAEVFTIAAQGQEERVRKGV